MRLLNRTYLAAFPLLVWTMAASGQVLHPRPAEPEPRAVQPVVEDSPSFTLTAGTCFEVEATTHYRMKVGEPIEARLMYPIYGQGKLLLEKGTLLRGSVTQLKPDTSMRWRGRFRGDFTPFHEVGVSFSSLELPTGAVSIRTTVAADGAPVLMLTTPGAKPKRNIFVRGWAMAKSRVHDRVAFFTDPGFGDRARQIFYSQLPYHPERIATGTAWNFELSDPLVFSSDFMPPSRPEPAARSSEKQAADTSEIWVVNAVLKEELTSKTAKPGDPVEATVVEPVYNHENTLVIPQGSVLVGKVAASKAAKSLGRNGKLRFNFQQIRFPEGKNQGVQGSLAGALADEGRGLAIDSEGTITQKSKASIIAPLFLTMLAGRAFDADGNMVLHSGAASNGFGLAGRIAGIAAQSRNVAAGIGFYAAALSVYDNFLTPGHDIVFPRDMRIQIETSPLSSPKLKRDEEK